jgi:hypothetical protein
VSGTAARGWPKEEIREVVISGLASRDTIAERDAARRRLTAALPIDARVLLYRLTLAVGRFDRALALAIASIPPAVAMPGEHLDELVGSWIEALGSNRYRVSPLVVGAGSEVLGAPEQQAIHKGIAIQIIQQHSVQISDANMIFTHSLLGKFEPGLMATAHSVLTAEDSTLRPLAEVFFTLRFCRYDQPIFPQDIRVSRVLRIAQFKLLSTTNDIKNINLCVSALVEEIAVEPELPLRDGLECLALSVILTTPGIGDYLSTWISLLND